MVRKDEYVIAIKNKRGYCTKDIVYKVFDIIEKGTTNDSWGIHIEYSENYYFIIHNNKFTFAETKYFKSVVKYNREIKIKKIEKNYER